MTRKDYLTAALLALASGDDAQAAAVLLERPGTLRDALRALLYRVDFRALRDVDAAISANKLQ